MTSSSYQESHTPDPSLLEPYKYITSLPGKDVRGTLIDCFQVWLKVEQLDVLSTVKVRMFIYNTLSSSNISITYTFYFEVIHIIRK